MKIRLSFFLAFAALTGCSEYNECGGVEASATCMYDDGDGNCDGYFACADQSLTTWYESQGSYYCCDGTDCAAAAEDLVDDVCEY